MNTARTSVLGFCLLGALAWAAVSAAQAPSVTPSPAPKDPFVRQTQSGLSGIGYVGRGGHDRAQELAKAYVKATKDDEKAAIIKELSDVLNGQFDQRMQQQQKELDDLEKQIADLKATLKKRLDAKSQIVKRRMEQLVQAAEGLGWNTSGSPGPKGGGLGGFTPSYTPKPATAPAPVSPALKRS